MATELETRTRTTTNTGRRIFTDFEAQDSIGSYKRPNFSGINFEGVETVDIQTNYNTTIEEIAVETPRQMDILTVDKTIEQRPQTPLKVKLNARGRIIVSVLAICICALMAFMVGNIVTLNSLNGTLAQKQQIVMEQQQAVSDLQDRYDSINNSLQDNAANNGYIEIDANQVGSVNGVTELAKPEAVIEGNWFDTLCNWLSNIFK